MSRLWELSITSWRGVSIGAEHWQLSQEIDDEDYSVPLIDPGVRP